MGYPSPHRIGAFPTAAAALVLLPAFAAAADEKTTGLCDVQRYSIGDLSSSKLEALMQSANAPFVITGASGRSPAGTYQNFVAANTDLQVIPKAFLELSVDGRIRSKDHPSMPRPSISVAGYLQHIRLNVEDVQPILYGRVLSRPEVILRVKQRHEADKKERNKNAETSSEENINSEGTTNVFVPPQIRAAVDDLAKAEVNSMFSGISPTPTTVLFLARPGGALPFQSHGEAFHIGLAGSSTMFLYPPTGVPKSVSAQFILSDIDPEYLRLLPNESGPLVCDIKAGDAIFVPAFWHYARHSIDASVSVSLVKEHIQKIAKKASEIQQIRDVLEQFPGAHQHYVDLALSLVRSDPKECVELMNKAVKVSPHNLALQWQVARLFSKIGAKGDSLNLASKSLKLLSKASGAGVPGVESGEEDDDEFPGIVSKKLAKTHWMKFGQLLLFELNMPLEAVVCFQMRLRITPKDAQVHLLKIRALTTMGAIPESRVALQDLLKVDPDNDQAKSMLKELDSDEAKNLAETMAEMGSGDKFSKEALKAITDEDGRVKLPVGDRGKKSGD